MAHWETVAPKTNKALVKLKMGFNKINNRLKSVNNENNFTR